jgi:hypothetical protein
VKLSKLDSEILQSGKPRLAFRNDESTELKRSIDTRKADSGLKRSIDIPKGDSTESKSELKVVEAESIYYTSTTSTTLLLPALLILEDLLYEPVGDIVPALANVAVELDGCYS